MSDEFISLSDKEHIIEQIDGLINAGKYNDAIEINIRTYEEALANDEYRMIAYSLFFFGLIEEKQGDPQKSMVFYKKATAIARKYRVYDGLVRTLNNSGNLYVLSGKINDAIDKYLEALSIHESHKHYEDGSVISGKEKILNNLGVLFIELKEYEKSKKYLFECTVASKEKKDELLLTTAYSNLTEIYILENNFLKAKYYNQLSREISRRIKDDIGIGIAYCFDAVIMNTEEQNWKQAKKLFEKALTYLGGIEMDHDRDDVLLKYGREAFKAKDYECSIQVLEGLCADIREKEFYQFELSALEILSQIYEKRQQFKEAYKFCQRRLEIQETTYMQFKNLSFERLDKGVNGAIEMRQIDELQRSIKTLKTLSEIGRQITACITKEDIFRVLFESVDKIFNYDAFGVAVMKPNTSKIEYEYLSEDFKGKMSISLKDEDYLMVQCILRGSEIIVFDAQDHIANEEQFDGRLLYIIKHADNQSIIFSPLSIKDYTMGGITIQSKKKGQFTYVDLESLRVLTSYVAIAFSNIFRAEQLVVANEKLEYVSQRDGLTGAYNRHALGQYIGKDFIGLLQDKLPTTALMIDIDYFKQYNDKIWSCYG